MERNRKAIQQEIATLAFYMQGGLDYNDAFMLSAEQRATMSKIIEKHYEAMSGKANSRLI
jgi:hypothetical protein